MFCFFVFFNFGLSSNQECALVFVLLVLAISNFEVKKKISSFDLSVLAREAALL